LTYSDKLREKKENERDIKDALKQKRIEEKEMKHEVGPLKCSISISPQGSPAPARETIIS